MYRGLISPLAKLTIRRPVPGVARSLSDSIAGRLKTSVNNLFPQHSVALNARSLLFNCKYQAENTLWYTRGKVGTDWRSKQTLLMVHIWLIHRRLILEGMDGQTVQEALFDQLWEDTTHRMRAVGIGEMSLNKYLKGVQDYSFRTCVELDHAVSLLKIPQVDVAMLKKYFGRELVPESVGDDGILTSPEVEQVVTDEILGVLWRHVYMKKEELPEGHLDVFAEYLFSEYKTMLQIPAEAVFESRIAFGPVPTWGAKVDSTQRSHRDRVPVASDKGEWRVGMAVDGKSYYWNTLTRETTWEKPADS